VTGRYIVFSHVTRLRGFSKEWPTPTDAKGPKVELCTM